MENNVGGTERIVRLVLGALLVVAAGVIYFEVFTVTGLLGASLVVAGALVGASLIVTGAVSSDPINGVIGRNSAHVSEEVETPVETESPPESDVGRAH